MSSPSVFLSYRREDSAGHAGRIADHLASRLGAGRVFLDVDAIAPGEEFEGAIQGRIEQSDVVLIVIGSRWLEVDGHGARRIDDPGDVVHREVAMALSSKALVVPVLVAGAAMPDPDQLPSGLGGLASRNAAIVDDRDFHASVERLLNQVRTARPDDEVHDGLLLAALLALGTVFLDALFPAVIQMSEGGISTLWGEPGLFGPPLSAGVLYALLMLSAAGGFMFLARGRLVEARIAAAVQATTAVFLLFMRIPVSFVEAGGLEVSSSSRAPVELAVAALLAPAILFFGPSQRERSSTPPAGTGVVGLAVAVAVALAIPAAMAGWIWTSSATPILLLLPAMCLVAILGSARWPSLLLGVVVGFAPSAFRSAFVLPEAFHWAPFPAGALIGFGLLMWLLSLVTLFIRRTGIPRKERPS